MTSSLVKSLSFRVNFNYTFQLANCELNKFADDICSKDIIRVKMQVLFCRVVKYSTIIWNFDLSCIDYKGKNSVSMKLMKPRDTGVLLVLFWKWKS